ncbi:hypothetical protein QE152_g36534 [Popillia japonica]|uniref:Uncharacterized protein n=1 Tax=Popillia japonica TaxID=7064 RepID=A0AAW1ID75_POPJA
MLMDLLWLTKLAYLSDIFTKLNELNLRLQGQDTTIFTMQEKVESTIEKMSLWTSLIDRLNEDVKSAIKCHLQNLPIALLLPEMSSNGMGVNNPFRNCHTDHIYISDQEELIDISCNSSLKSCFVEQSLVNFWAFLDKLKNQQ